MIGSDKPLNPELLTDFQQWKQANDEDFSLWDYLSGVATVEMAIAFTKLFWPDFVEHEKGIFLAEAFDVQIYQDWKEKLGCDISAIERMMNHQHIDDLLPGADRVGIENLVYLGNAIATMWESRLQSLYPGREFQVNCDRDEYTVVVTFHSKNRGFVDVLREEMRRSSVLRDDLRPNNPLAELLRERGINPDEV